MADIDRMYLYLNATNEAKPPEGIKDPDRYARERIFFNYNGQQYETIWTKDRKIEVHGPIHKNEPPEFMGYANRRVTGVFPIARLIILNRLGKWDAGLARTVAQKVKKTARLPKDMNVYVTNKPSADVIGAATNVVVVTLGRPKHQGEEGAWLANYYHPRGHKVSSGYYYDSPEKAIDHVRRGFVESREDRRSRLKRLAEGKPVAPSSEFLQALAKAMERFPKSVKVQTTAKRVTLIVKDESSKLKKVLVSQGASGKIGVMWWYSARERVKSNFKPTSVSKIVTRILQEIRMAKL